MTAEEVAQFFKTHPQFFDQHPQLLEAIFVPHPYGGRAIPLSERQILALRDKVRLLEGKLAELLQFGEENDAIGEKVHRLAAALLGARDFAGPFIQTALSPPAQAMVNVPPRVCTRTGDLSSPRAMPDTAAAHAPVPQERVSPAPRSNTRRRIECRSTTCM